ncbi:hypothetical protein [Elizabethkingia occulta]|uniref:hypothetical protein n=1 Tax=Elizabethkingia occulta TaxID=1867263 RepID=UPI00099AE928|nr:hypothetical protein [Elizabethkingia occulta]OPB97994.1 hypothetical protein BB020_14315 [Elizabethkingia occulta]
MKTYSCFTIILIFIFFSSCKEKEFVDKIILNSSYNKDANALEIELSNDTKKNYIVLFSRSFTLSNHSDELKNQIDHGTVDKISDSNNDYKLSAKLKTYINSTSLKEIKKIYEEKFHISPNDYDSVHLNFPTVFEINAGRKIVLRYNLDKQPKVKGEYKVKSVRMRDVLNNDHNISLAREIVLRKRSNFDVYLDDFYVKDSILVKK